MFLGIMKYSLILLCSQVISVCVCVCVCVRVCVLHESERGGEVQIYSNNLVQAVSEYTKKEKYRIGNAHANSHISSYSPPPLHISFYLYPIAHVHV